MDCGVFKRLHEYSSIIGPSSVSHTQNNSVFRYFLCIASYTPRMEHAVLDLLNRTKRGSETYEEETNLPFSIQSISLLDSASIGINFFIFISVDSWSFQKIKQ